MPQYVFFDQRKGAESRGLLLTKCEWDHFKKQVTRREDERRKVELEAEERENRRAVSKAMADTWDNTFLNLRKIRFAQRKERLEKAEQAVHMRFLKIKEEEEKRKVELRQKAREIFFEMRDSTKSLRSAEKLCETLKERQEQMKFNIEIKEKQKQEGEKYARKIFEDVELWKKEQEEESQTQLINKEKRKQDTLNELALVQEQKERQAKRQREEEVEYLSEMIAELDQIKLNEKLDAAKRRQRYLEDITQNHLLRQKKKQSAMEEAREEEAAIKIIHEGKIKLAKLRREKEEDMAREKLERRASMANRVASEQKNKDDVEEEIHIKASEEKEKIYQEELKRKKEYSDKLRQERIEYFKEYFTLKEINKAKEEELIKFTVLQRLKNEETTNRVRKAYNETRRNWFQECRKVNGELIDERTRKEMESKQTDEEAVKRAAAIWDLNDQEFLEFSEKLRNECLAKNRPTYPLDIAIRDYKIKHGLLVKRQGKGLVPPRSKVNSDDKKGK